MQVGKLFSKALFVYFVAVRAEVDLRSRMLQKETRSTRSGSLSVQLILTK
ncbi:hypothetical protein QO000_001150 [Alkalihalobacillus hemicentroti]|uniref:Uncharacterized protein n=1 Tax=Guptibacillus hwajinpoensis TaxID=208199 RepID=A0ABU0JYL9_9BACL|nr:hypothetical protein [Alkalihalobacillus hemicentroti]